MIEGWLLTIRAKTMEVSHVHRFYFAIDVVDESATYRERAAELAVSMTPMFGWWNRWRSCFSIQTQFNSVLFQRQWPTKGWWDDGSIAFSGTRGAYAFAPKDFSLHVLAKWYSGVEGTTQGWSTIGPMPWVMAIDGRVNNLGIAAAEDFISGHVNSRIGVLGDTIYGATVGEGNFPHIIFAGDVFPYVGRSKLRRRKI